MSRHLKKIQCLSKKLEMKEYSQTMPSESSKVFLISQPSLASTPHINFVLNGMPSCRHAIIAKQ